MWPRRRAAPAAAPVAAAAPPAAHGAEAPSAWVERFAAGVPPGARVLDVACGRGRHARLFAALGCLVDAVDIDAEAGAALAELPQVNFLCADLENAPWPYEGRRFDAVVVTNYLHRPLFDALAAALAPGGRLIYETFMVGHERFGRPNRPAFLLQPRELLAVFGRTLEVIAFEEGVVSLPRPARVSRLCAVRPGAAREAHLRIDAHA